ncbi:alkaline phosphatase D family protein [Rosistilla oblonga]|uniref:alkaline phosphatase D family protein n=1 Tax=Rosistilla oblonga TaxID=2527990 RepID=UPI003A9830A0
MSALNRPASVETLADRIALFASTRVWRVGLLVVLIAAIQLPACANDVVGPIVGAVESTTAHLLYRPAAAEKRMRLTLLSESGDVIKTVDANSEQANDYVAKFAVAGLQPGTTYRYKIEELTEKSNRQAKPIALVEADAKHAFTTATLARDDNRVSVGFVSCVDIEPNGMWADMRKLGIDTLCLMGDTPYIDTADLKVVRDRHRKFMQMDDLATLARSTPVVGTWDDHDFGLNNGNGLNMQTGKPATRRGFVEYRAHSQYGNGGEGVYHKVDLGMIEVFLLDPRYFSQTEPSPVDPSQPTCFGKQQWEWLLEGLRQSKAPFKVLAMGAIWQDKKNRETDDMFTYWYERDALLDFVKQQKIGGVVLLGGDIHVARHLRHPQRVGYDLHDFVISPGHTRVITELDVYHPSLEWSLVEGWQFLTLTASGKGTERKLVAQFRQPDGIVNREVVIDLESATPNPTEENGDTESLSRELRAYWSFDGDLSNASVLGDRIDASAENGAAVVADAGIRGGAVQLKRSQQQFLNVPRSFLDENSTTHTVSAWFRSDSLPAHGSSERQFLLESTAEGSPDGQRAWHLSLGLRTGENPDQVNLQVHTVTLQPAAKPEAAPQAIAQTPFGAMLDRDKLKGQWNHVALTFDGQRMQMFFNGQIAIDQPLPIPGPAAEFGGLILGGHRAGVGRNFDGAIDEVAIWQRVLSAAELQSLYGNGKPAKIGQ